MAARSTQLFGELEKVALHLKKAGFHGIVVVHSKNDDGVEVRLKILPYAKRARFGI